MGIINKIFAFLKRNGRRQEKSGSGVVGPFLPIKIEKRRRELEEQLANIDERLISVKNRIAAIRREKESLVKAEFSISEIKVGEYNSPKVKFFESDNFRETPTMLGLFKQRIEEERRKTQEAERDALAIIENAQIAIKSKNIARAKDCLDAISKLTVFIENRDINNAIKELALDTTDLQNQIEADKRERVEQQRKKDAVEAQRRAETQMLKRQEVATRKQLEQEERKKNAKRFEESLKEKEDARKEEVCRLKGLSSKFKEDAKEIGEFLRINHIHYFYHFTEESNLKLIKSRKGLYSWSYLVSHGMKIPSPGGDDVSRGVDRDKGLQDYVRLSLCATHPMAFRIHQESNGKAKIFLLKIKIDVATFESTLFSNVNAADKLAIIGSNKEFLENNINFEAVLLKWCKGDDPRFKERQAEVLVKTFIPSKFIVNLDNPDVMTF